VILGADFLSKTGIDVKYSTGIIEWFDNCHCMTHAIFKAKTFLAMAETIDIQFKDDFLGWIGMIQPAMHLKFWMQSMKRSLLMML
jgi:hypothetical protein